MLRPPRSKGRFQGEGTSLSNPYAEADGRRLRRRYCVYTILLVLLIVGIVAAVKKPKKSTTLQAETPEAPPGSFVMESQSTIPEIKAKVKTFKHKKSGMPILAIVPDDTTQDAVFGMSFRTKVEDNSGIAYVVLKAIQDGSKNFPIKDPFNQLTRGSLQTHMDSWVEKDRSNFVYASRNKIDFRNGIKVYLDGIFNPNLMSDDHAWIFRQEAWRFLLGGPKGTELMVSGNALNEAKVSQMNPAIVHEDYIYNKTFHGHPYQFMQKGDFRDVVTLTHTKLKNFYTKYYHPSNGHAFCFGPQDFVNECMNLMEPYLSQYQANDKIRKASEVSWVDLDEIKSIREEVPYPTYQDAKDFRFAASFILNDQPMDDRTKMAWYIIEDLLLGSSAAVIPRVIVDQKLGDDAFGGLQSNLRQWVLTLGVSGIPDTDTTEIARIRLMQAVYNVTANGFDDAAIKGTLNKLDMRFREQSSTGVPLGVKLFKDVLTTWTYDEDPRKPLSYSKVFADLKSEIEKNGQGMLLQLMTRHISDNKHSLMTNLYPSTEMLALYKSQEEDWLARLGNYISKDEALAMLQETDDLKEVQQTPDSQEVLAKISTLTVKDLRSMNFKIPTKVYENIFDSGITMLEHEVPHTNGIAYVDFSIDISNMDFDDIVLLPLFCELLTKAGNSYENGIDIQREIDAMTGGMTVAAIVEEIVDVGSDGGYIVPSGQNMVTKIVVRSSCLAQTGCLPMFNLIKQVLYDADVQKQTKAIEILKKMIDDMEDDVQIKPHEYTALRILSQYGLPGFIREQWMGITQLLNLRRALNQAINDWDALSIRLVLMADAMRKGHRSGMTLSLAGDRESIKGISSGVQRFIKDVLPIPTQTTPFPDFAKTVHPWYTKGNKRWSDEVNAEGENEAFLTPTRLNAIAKGGLLFEPGEPITGSDIVVLQYIGGYFLYNELRFGQGAAEAKAIVDIDTGAVVYQTNQAPDIIETLDIYDQGSSFVLRELQGKSSLPPEAEGAVIGAIGQIDGTAMQPSEIGYISLVQYLKQERDETRQKFRDQVLATNVKSFLSMADRLGSWGKPSIAIITNQEQYQAATEHGIQLTTCNYTGLYC